MPVTLQRARAQGFTLVEFLVAMAVLAILLASGMPAFAEFLVARRLSASADIVHAQAVFARNEAIKRNGTVLFEVEGGAVRVREDDDARTLIRSATLPTGVLLETARIRFGAHGRTRPDGAALELAPTPTGGCTDPTLSCPRVRITAGGHVQVCRTQTCS